MEDGGHGLCNTCSLLSTVAVTNTDQLTDLFGPSANGVRPMSTSDGGAKGVASLPRAAYARMRSSQSFVRSLTGPIRGRQVAVAGRGPQEAGAFLRRAYMYTATRK